MTSDDEHRPTPSSEPPPSRNDRLQELGTVTGELLHDLGGVLSVLSARVALASEEAGLGRVPGEELERIQRDTDELGRMVREILDELQGAHPSPEVTFPVVATVEREVERWLVRAPSVNVVLESTLPETAEIAGPRSFFSRAVGNLLRNAARYARREVHVTVRPGREEGAAEVRVEDDGTGIAEEMRDRLFGAFASGGPGSAEAGGTGLGLSFARWGIRRLRGELVVDEEPSRLGGACFRMTLPLWSGAAARQDTAPGTAEAIANPVVRESRPGYGRRSGEDLEGIRLTVVEDDPGVRRVFARLLRRSGAHVEAMDPAAWSSMNDGVRRIRESQPHAILLDLNLDVMSGLDLYDRLRQAAPHLADRVLFLTGGVAPHEELDRPLVNKMIVWDEFLAAVRRVIEFEP